MKFQSTFSLGKAIKEPTIAAIKSEPMLWNCDLEHAKRIGHELTNNFINALPQSWTDGPLVFDSRTHMLMPGWFPCIPGWHHDDLPRTREDKQPNYFDNSVRAEHAMMLFNGDICPTEFAIGDIELDIPGENEIIYRLWHPKIDLACDTGVLRKQSIPSATVAFFNDRTWHQGTAAKAGGFRFFIRASRHFNANGERIAKPGILANEQRFQSQVYMPDPYVGW